MYAIFHLLLCCQLPCVLPNTGNGKRKNASPVCVEKLAPVCVCPLCVFKKYPCVCVAPSGIRKVGLRAVALEYQKRHAAAAVLRHLPTGTSSTGARGGGGGVGYAAAPPPPPLLPPPPPVTAPPVVPPRGRYTFNQQEW